MLAHGTCRHVQKHCSASLQSNVSLISFQDRLQSLLSIPQHATNALPFLFLGQISPQVSPDFFFEITWKWYITGSFLQDTFMHIWFPVHPSKQAGSDSPPIRIGSEAFARSGPDGSILHTGLLPDRIRLAQT